MFSAGEPGLGPVLVLLLLPFAALLWSWSLVKGVPVSYRQLLRALGQRTSVISKVFTMIKVGRVGQYKGPTGWENPRFFAARRAISAR